MYPGKKVRSFTKTSLHHLDKFTFFIFQSIWWFKCRYPKSPGDFVKSGLEGIWDSRLAGTRMKFPPSETWENMCSNQGNTSSVWEKLISKQNISSIAWIFQRLILSVYVPTLYN